MTFGIVEHGDTYSAFVRWNAGILPYIVILMPPSTFHFYRHRFPSNETNLANELGDRRMLSLLYMNVAPSRQAKYPILPPLHNPSYTGTVEHFLTQIGRMCLPTLVSNQSTS